MNKTMLAVLSGVLVILALAWDPVRSAETEPRYTNERYGLSLPLSQDVRLYTPENPGPFTFEGKNLCILVNKWKPSDLIMLNCSGIPDEVELDNFMLKMQATGLPQPGYRKVAVRYTTVGDNPPKRAVEHIFELGGAAPRIMRQVYFTHKGQGFALVATSVPDRFEDINKTFFDPVFRSLRFE
ncbi:MAG: hypothetical protein ACUVXF_04530 [Desulfobaccales bacterium]